MQIELFVGADHPTQLSSVECLTILTSTNQNCFQHLSTGMTWNEALSRCKLSHAFTNAALPNQVRNENTEAAASPFPFPLAHQKRLRMLAHITCENDHVEHDLRLEKS